MRTVMGGLTGRDALVVLADGATLAAVVMVGVWYAWAARRGGERRRSAGRHVLVASAWAAAQILKGAYSFVIYPRDREWRAYVEIALDAVLIVSLYLVLRSGARRDGGRADDGG